MTDAGSDLCEPWKQGYSHSRRRPSSKVPGWAWASVPVHPVMGLRGSEMRKGGQPPGLGRHDALGIPLSSHGAGTESTFCRSQPQGGGRPLTNPGASWGWRRPVKQPSLCHPTGEKEHLLLQTLQAVGSAARPTSVIVSQEEPDLLEERGCCALICQAAPSQGALPTGFLPED